MMSESRMKIIAKKFCNEIYKLRRAYHLIAEDNLKHGYYEKAVEMVNKSKEFLKYLKRLEVDKKKEIGYE